MWSDRVVIALHNKQQLDNKPRSRTAKRKQPVVQPMKVASMMRNYEEVGSNEKILSTPYLLPTINSL